MKLVVGLGNPGKRYDGTRHNVGFDVVAELARRHASGMIQSKFQGEVVDCRIKDQQTSLLCPNTYMNNSGRSVRAAFDFYKLEVDSVLVICDDFNLPLGKLRFRLKGSAGGQKGLMDILQKLGTQEVSRLRIGIGQVPARWDVADYVLSRFTKEEKEIVKEATIRAANGVAEWVESGTQYCMNRYNAS